MGENSVSDSAGTVARALSVLTFMAEAKDSIGVKDIAAALNLPMSTSHRLLDLLMEGGFVEKDEKRRRYSIGMEFRRLANLVSQRASYATAIQPVLDRITKETGETALYVEYLPTKRAAMYSAKSDSPHSLRFRINLFQEMPVEWGASGLAILAFLPPDVQAKIHAANRASPTTKKRMSMVAFFERIESIRRNGYAVSEGEKLADSVGIAVPVVFGGDHVGASLALTIPKVRFVRSQVSEHVGLLKREAELIAKGPLQRRNPPAKEKSK
jgi:DNA-binding IclR family transcriptional regulator